VDIGILREQGIHEHRVALTPAAVKDLVQREHRVFVEHGAGEEAGHGDTDYQAAGATTVYGRIEVFARSQLLLGIYAPTPEEYASLVPGQVIVAFWALPASHPDTIRALCERQVTAVGVEIIEEDDAHAPVLTSMSEIAGRLAVTVGSGLLLNELGGKGILLSGAPGVPPANLVVLGAGVLGRAAALSALKLGAEVLLLDRSVAHLRRAFEELGHSVPTMLATPPNIERALSFADLVIASPALRGERSPMLVTRDMLGGMKPRSVVMDLAIDMGGCLETSRPTYFPKPVFEVDGILHFCVPNMPTIAARSATLAFSNAIHPYVVEIASKGFEKAVGDSHALRRGTYIHGGRMAKEPLARIFGLPYEPLAPAVV
jgi:alanine dehydrogenase